MSSLALKLSQMFRFGSRGGRHGDPVKVSANDSGDSDRPAPAPLDRSQRDLVVQQLRDGYGEMVDTMQVLRNHMEDQAQRSDRLLRLMDGLPQVLRSIPEANERQTQVLEAIRGHMETQVESSSQLTTALTSLATATDRQQHSIAGMQTHLESARDSNHALRDSLDVLSGTMQAVTQTTRSGTEAIQLMAEQTDRNQVQTQRLFHQTQKHTTVMSAVSWALALVALSVAGYVAFSIARSAPLGAGQATAGMAPLAAPTGAEPAGIAPVATPAPDVSEPVAVETAPPPDVPVEMVTADPDPAAVPFPSAVDPLESVLEPVATGDMIELPTAQVNLGLENDAETMPAFAADQLIVSDAPAEQPDPPGKVDAAPQDEAADIDATLVVPELPLP